MGRTATKHALTAATLVLLALGAWLAWGLVPLRHDTPEPEPVWTPITRDTGGIHA